MYIIRIEYNVVNLLSGAFCGITVDCTLFPLDTIKTYIILKKIYRIDDFKQDKEL